MKKSVARLLTAQTSITRLFDDLRHAGVVMTGRQQQSLYDLRDQLQDSVTDQLESAVEHETNRRYEIDAMLKSIREKKHAD